MGLIKPGSLILLLFIIPLLFLFFYKSRYRAIRIDSLFFWKIVFNKKHLYKSGWFNKKNYLLLFAQILIVIFLALSLAGLFLYRDKNPIHTVVLLDASASMNIKYNGKSRFSHACKDALRLINTATANKQIALAHFGNDLRLVTPLLNDRKILRSYLNNINPSDQKGEISKKHINLLQDSYSNTIQIVVLTDHVPDIAESENVSYKIFNGSDGNAAITSLKLINKTPKKSIIKVKLQCDYVKPFYIPLVIEKNGNLILEKELSLNSGEMAEIEIPLKINQWIDASGVIKIGINDAYYADNKACFTVKPRISIQMNGKSDNLLRALKANSNVLLDKNFDPSKKNIQVSVNQPGGGDFYANHLIVNPVSGHNSLSIGEKVDLNKPIKIFYRDHPFLKNVNLGMFVVPSAYRIDLPEGAVVLAEIDKIPLLFFWQNGGDKLLAVNFPIDETEFITQISFPIFIANALEWMCDGKAVKNDALLSEDESITVKTEKKYREAEIRKNIYLKKICIIVSLVLFLCEGVFFYGVKKQRRAK